MKINEVIIFFSLLTLLLFGCISNQSPPAPEKPVLTIITYDGFNSEYGLGRVIIPKFEAQCNCTVHVQAGGDVGWVVARALSSSGDEDIVLGIDNSYRGVISSRNVFESYKPQGYEELHPDVSDNDYRFIPYDFGFIALMYDSERVNDYPRTLEDMTDPRFKGMIVIPDPRTSSTGRTFVMWVAGEYKNNTKNYFERLKPNLLAITPGWTESYGMFTSGEVPYVLSYTTSPAYHVAFEDTTRYKAIMFPSMYKQVEYVSILKTSRNKELAKEFIDFMLTAEVQEEIALGNFMYPSVRNIAFPDAFSVVSYPDSIVEEVDDSAWIEVWEDVYR